MKAVELLGSCQLLVHLSGNGVRLDPDDDCGAIFVFMLFVQRKEYGSTEWECLYR